MIDLRTVLRYRSLRFNHNQPKTRNILEGVRETFSLLQGKHGSEIRTLWADRAGHLGVRGCEHTDAMTYQSQTSGAGTGDKDFTLNGVYHVHHIITMANIYRVQGSNDGSTYFGGFSDWSSGSYNSSQGHVRAGVFWITCKYIKLDHLVGGSSAGDSWITSVRLPDR